MPGMRFAPLPAGALLESYARARAYTDCYPAKLGQPAVFKLERMLLPTILGIRSTDDEADGLAQGNTDTFAAWRVEHREPNQAILAAGRPDRG